jgi:hypothetical protein
MIERTGLTRRQLITRGLVASGALVVGGISVRYGPIFFQEPMTGLSVLTRKEHDIIISLLEVFFPKEGDMPPADEHFIIPRLDQHLADTHRDMRLLFRAMLHTIEDHAAVMRFSRFTKLSREERTAEVRAWETTPLYLKRMGFSSVKFLIGMFYFEQPDVREAMGFYLGCSPDHLDTAKKDRLG